jgi:hypothetical protein
VRNFTIPPEINGNNSTHFMHESGGETTRNESLADGNTTLLVLSESNLISSVTYLMISVI